ncbi:hypothetical protein SODALDRAFT_131195 [Sodiomyces alkalinus F11]|uniref:Uncharacterized protein n=1 Tax=Sodiomyces alkalinus (strain CBS 110278 / VKM F-3762 / F11) TaxID=1314773 RepID=A0A3N2PYC2_SODAK|nr:hypothetical protein SODALDRAFT_131195 [Sodiomyces alkalinus F11]ROT39497.1 hypothetical protein SODALDRAFT_131195 [Sodiomyces alkalinus F11]
MWRDNEGAAVATRRGRWPVRRRGSFHSTTIMRMHVMRTGGMVPQLLPFSTRGPSSSIRVFSARRASARLRCGHRRAKRRGARARARAPLPTPMQQPPTDPSIITTTPRGHCPCRPPRHPERYGPRRSSLWTTASTGSRKRMARPLCRWRICLPSPARPARWLRRRLPSRRCPRLPSRETSWGGGDRRPSRGGRRSRS